MVFLALCPWECQLLRREGSVRFRAIQVGEFPRLTPAPKLPAGQRGQLLLLACGFAFAGFLLVALFSTVM